LRGFAFHSAAIIARDNGKYSIKSYQPVTNDLIMALRTINPNELKKDFTVTLIAPRTE
jgi:hypothetical protein